MSERLPVSEQMLPGEFVAAMKKIASNKDKEAAHGDADELMCKVLRQAGFGDGIEIYEELTKWYA